jgi:hypothetical protein
MMSDISLIFRLNNFWKIIGNKLLESDKLAENCSGGGCHHGVTGGVSENHILSS